MKATQTLFIIVMVAILNISATSRNNNHVSANSNQSQQSIQSQKVSLANSAALSIVAQTDLGGSDNHSSHPQEEGGMHFFHFARIKRIRRHCNALCFIAKFILIVVHLSLLYCHYLTFFIHH